MDLSVPDYKKLYKLQDKVFEVIKGNLNEFYLTGGTALGRFYLNHRFSEDLDFFVNNSDDFHSETQRIHNLIRNHFQINMQLILDTPSFYRIWIVDEVNLKLEFVNDVKYHAGKIMIANDLRIDNPANILSNKLTAVLSRDEPKDVFDICMIADSFAFNWKEIYYHALEKQLVNEASIAMRLSTFPIDLFDNVIWKKQELDKSLLKENIEIIVDDFLFARDNSLGIGKPSIMDAKPIRDHRFN
jgi:predicted nucleotidyltransferase component of viral defense system